jgi:lipid A 3-O-deacylase
MRLTTVLMLCLLSLFLSGTAVADRSLTFSAGHFGVKAKDSVPDPQWFGLEYRWAPIHLWQLVPSIGYARGGQGTYYIYHDLGREFPFFDDRMYIRLSSGPGYYRGERMRDLGHKIEFRSGIELGFRTTNGLTIGAAIYHLSNASISSENPGVEYATLNITMPF